MSGPSQPKVEGENWSDERIKGFLDLKPLDETNADYHVLLQAYHHMTPEFFERLVAFFVEAGRDINALSATGQTILGRVSEHGRSKAYAEILTAKGAKAA